jgi:FkbM family methyltransferase
MSAQAGAPFGTFAPSGLQRAVMACTRATFLHRGTFRPTMSALLRASGPQTIDAVFEGAPMRLDLTGNSVSSAALLAPAYNGREIGWLRKALPVGGTFVDIGANVGLYSAPLARQVGPGGRVVSVEPSPAMAASLRRNAGLGEAWQIVVVEAAVGAENGRAVFGLHPQDEGGNRLGQTEIAGRSIEVRQVTLETLLDETGIDRPDALKIDIEGYEDRALLPFFETVARTRWPRALAIEICKDGSWQRDVFAELLRLGYVEDLRTRNNGLFRLVEAS